MRLKKAMISGITTIGSQAPTANFVTPTMSRTTKVAHGADGVDGQALAPARSSRRRWWWRTMPAWLSVNEVNTPTA